MYCDPLQINLNDISYIIRPMEVEDAQQALTFMKRMYEDSPYLTRYADEWNLGIEDEVAYIKMNREAADMLLCGVFFEEKMIGIGSWAAVGRVFKVSHRCTTSIAVSPEYQGKGIGAALMDLLVAQARNAGFEQMELEVVSDNVAAVHLYEKLGFKRYGTLKRGFRNRDGSYCDLVGMVLSL